MIGWWKHKIYYGDVMAQLMMMTLMIGPEGKLIEKHSGIRAAIRKNFKDGTAPMVTATHLAAALMSYAIERDGDLVHLQIVEELLRQWSLLDPVEQRQLSARIQDGTLDQDMLLTRCQWLLLRGQDMLLDGKIEMHDFRILKDSIYGPLKGEEHGSRIFDRIDAEMDRVLGPGV